MLNRTFYLEKIEYSKEDPNWAYRYLHSPVDRVTSILKKELGPESLKNYFKNLITFYNNEKLVLRVEIIYKNKIEVWNVWSSQENFIKFENQSTSENRTIEIFKENNIKYFKIQRAIDHKEILQKFIEIDELPYVIHYISLELDEMLSDYFLKRIGS